jgi:putative tricarboxylic transport membrane protein
VRDAGRLKGVLPYAAVAAGAAYLYSVAADIQYPARAGTLGPDFWPKLVLALMLVVCAAKIVATLALGGREEGGLLQGVIEEPEPAPESNLWTLAGGMVLSVAYVWALPRLGFFSATVPYLAAFIALGGYRRWGVVAALSIGGALALVFFFMKVVYVSLPLGQGPFQQVTLALMQLMGIR